MAEGSRTPTTFPCCLNPSLHSARDTDGKIIFVCGACERRFGVVQIQGGQLRFVALASPEYVARLLVGALT